MRPVRVIAPEGSIVNAAPPAAVAGATWRLAAHRRHAFARAGAGSARTHSRCQFRHHEQSHDRRNRSAPGPHLPPTPITKPSPAASGFAQSPGASGHHAHMTNSLNTPIEALEYAFPFRMIQYAIRRGSGGAGRIAAATASCAKSNCWRCAGHAACRSPHHAAMGIGGRRARRHRQNHDHRDTKKNSPANHTRTKGRYPHPHGIPRRRRVGLKLRAKKTTARTSSYSLEAALGPHTEIHRSHASGSSNKAFRRSTDLPRRNLCVP